MLHRRYAVIGAAVVLATFLPTRARAQGTNYPDRRAYVINNCPMLELSKFSYENAYASGSTRFEQNLTWKNIGTQPVVAFEVVVLKYDAFNRRLIGSRWTVTGRNSADWRPLAPGASNSDGTIGYGEEEVYTAIAYVRAARLADGTIWTGKDADLLTALRKVAPDIAEFGDVKPDPKPAREGSQS